MIYIPLQNIRKLDTVAERGVIIELSEDVLWYKLYCNSTKNVVMSKYALN